MNETLERLVSGTHLSEQEAADDREHEPDAEEIARFARLCSRREEGGGHGRST